jgi:hypothetical protein
MMVEKDSHDEEPQRSAEGEPREEDAPQRERLKDLDITDSEGDALKGGKPLAPPDPSP